MKIALLGTDQDALALAAAARDSGHSIVWFGDVRPEDSNAVERLAPAAVDASHNWEVLLDGLTADAVVIGRGAAGGELRAEQLKRLAVEAVPLLVVQPACDSVLLYYELDMTRRETGAIVRHYNPLTSHPIVAELAAWVRDGHPTIGAIHQITCERRLVEDSRAGAMAELARDVELMALAGGDIRRVTAIGPRTAEASFASLQIQMTASGPATLRWSAGPPRGTATRLEMTLVGERGSAALRVDDAPDGQGHEWILQTRADGGDDRRPLEEYDPARAAIRRLAAAVAETNGERRAGASTWDAATRAMEVLDAVELSLDKGRTIDVFQQQLTERLAFRGTMAAIGCGLLLLGFFAVVLVTILGGAEGAIGQRLVPAWPLALLALLAFFLALQFVPLLATKSKRRNQ